MLRTNTDLGNAQETANQARNAITILTLGLSFLLLASFEVGLFGLIVAPRHDAGGMSSAVVPLWLDWVLTAAALTGGAKGLHHLLSKVQKSNEIDEAALLRSKPGVQRSAPTTRAPHRLSPASKTSTIAVQGARRDTAAVVTGSGHLRGVRQSACLDAYPDDFAKAVALLQSLARNHAFVDGNKRTAWAAARTFTSL